MYFEMLTDEDGLLKGATLHFASASIAATCLACGEEFPTETSQPVCPACGSQLVRFDPHEAMIQLTDVASTTGTTRRPRRSEQVQGAAGSGLRQAPHEQVLAREVGRTRRATDRADSALIGGTGCSRGAPRAPPDRRSRAGGPCRAGRRNARACGRRCRCFLRPARPSRFGDHPDVGHVGDRGDTRRRASPVRGSGEGRARSSSARARRRTQPASTVHRRGARDRRWRGRLRSRHRGTCGPGGGLGGELDADDLAGARLLEAARRCRPPHSRLEDAQAARSNSSSSAGWRRGVAPGERPVAAWS